MALENACCGTYDPVEQGGFYVGLLYNFLGRAVNVGDDPCAVWQCVLDQFPERTAIVSLNGQPISFANLDRAIASITNRLVDDGAGPGSSVACAIPSFAVVVASWLSLLRASL